VFVDDLLSNPVVAARDIERIQVAEISAEETAPPARLALSESRMRGKAQPGLFSDAPARAGAVYPDLEGWASQRPTLPADGKLRLSATAIEDYLSCPLKFKFSHFLKIPTGPQATLTFGNIMHQAVRHYFELSREGPPPFEALEEFYLRAWKDVGFEDTYQAQAYKKAGLEQLRAFVERQKESKVPAEKIRLEETFRLELGDVVLEGRIDQINPRGPAGDTAAELIDYKTGRPRSQKDADQSLQLSIYALAAREQLKLRPARLTFYNLTNNQPVSTVRMAKDLDRAVSVIHEVADQIRRSLFQPAPGYICQWCDYVPVCPAHEEIF
jgi:DNA helicase-2/ATP-dependent DNA helicase PcrA